MINQQILEMARGIPKEYLLGLAGFLALWKIFGSFSLALAFRRKGVSFPVRAFLPLGSIWLYWGGFAWFVSISIWVGVTVAAISAENRALVWGGILALLSWFVVYLGGSRGSVRALGAWSWLWGIPVVGAGLRVGYFWRVEESSFPKEETSILKRMFSGSYKGKSKTSKESVSASGGVVAGSSPVESGNGGIPQPTESVAGTADIIDF